MNINKTSNFKSNTGNTSLLERLKQTISEEKPIDEKLYYDISTASSKDLSWDLFYTLVDSQQEKNSGYWLSAIVASTLLKPVISKQFFKNQNDRVKENVDEDFLNDCIMEIARVIPGFDKAKSQFPNYITPYIMQVGYVHGNDLSVYLSKKTGIRVFSQNALTANAGEDNQQKDPYYNSASDYKIEEEVEKREKVRRSDLFRAIVIDKALSGPKEKEKRETAIESKRTYAKAMNLVKEINNATKGLSDGEVISISGMTITNDNKDEVINQVKERVNSSKKAISNDKTKTLVNATIWKKFLGGIPSFPESVLEDMIDEVSSQYSKEEEL